MIVLRGVCFDYRLEGERSISALRGVDLEIREGESVAVVGPNGSGKSTLARCLNGLLIPNQGTVSVDGLMVDGSEAISQVRGKVGMIFQNPDNQIVATPVEREIAFGLENVGMTRGEIRQRVEWALDTFDLQGKRHVPPHLLSGGEKQRLAIASVLAMRPKYVVLDEPTSLLDPKGRREVLKIIADLSRQPDLALIHITQFPQEALTARRLLVMVQGRAVMDGEPREILARGMELEKVGLRQPTVTRVVMGLSKHRIPISTAAQGDVDSLVGELGMMVGKGRDVPETDGGRNVRKTPNQMDCMIRLKGVKYVYDSGLPWEREALSDVDLTIGRGEFVGLIGPTGSGKTTFAQHLNGLLLPSQGTVTIGDLDVARRDDLIEIRQKVGLVFQFPEKQLFGETVYEDVAFAPRNMGLSETEVEGRVGEALRAVGLDVSRFSWRSPFSLSCGEQRRVAVAGILAMRPEILVLDEPTVGLDPSGTETMSRLVRDFHRSGGTVVLISHQMDLIFRWAERIIVLDGGRIVLDASPHDMIQEERRLRDLGLDLPETCQIMERLRERGWGVRVDLFSSEEVVDEIARHLRLEGKDEGHS